MVIEDIATAEKRVANRKAEEFRAKGYEVARNSPVEFMPDYVADIVAVKGTEHRVMAVKTRSSLKSLPQVEELAREVESRPNWSFDLVLVGEPGILDSPEGASLIDKEGMNQWIRQAEVALSNGLLEAAFLLAWSTCEAALRDKLPEARQKPLRIFPAYNMLEFAGYEGAIDRADYNYLVDAMKVRNALAHGLIVDGLDASRVTALIEVARRLVAE